MSQHETYRDEDEVHLTVDPDPKHVSRWTCHHCGEPVTNLAICPYCGAVKTKEGK